MKQLIVIEPVSPPQDWVVESSSEVVLDANNLKTTIPIFVERQRLLLLTAGATPVSIRLEGQRIAKDQAHFKLSIGCTYAL